MQPSSKKTSFLNRRNLIVWLTGLTVLYQICYHMFLWRTLENEEALQDECNASGADASNSPQCLEVQLFRAWQEGAPLLQRAAAERRGGAVETVPLIASSSTKPTSVPAADAALADEAVEEPAKSSEEQAFPAANGSAASPVDPLQTSWAQNLEESLNHLKAMNRNHSAAHGKVTRKLKSSEKQSRKPHKKQSKKGKKADRRLHEKYGDAKKAKHKKKGGKRRHRAPEDEEEEDGLEYEDDADELDDKELEELATLEEETAKELQEVEADDKEFEDLAKLEEEAAEELQQAEEDDKQLDQIDKETEEFAREQEVWAKKRTESLITMLSDMEHLFEDGTDGQEASSATSGGKTEAKSAEGNIKKPAVEDGVAAFDRKSTEMAEELEKWEKDFLERYGWTSVTEGPKKHQEKSTSLRKGHKRLHWKRVWSEKEWAPRESTKGEVVLGRSELHGSHWSGKKPKVACVTAITSGEGAKIKVKHLVADFQRQSYDGVSRLILVYHYTDLEAEKLVLLHSDGDNVVGVAAGGHNEFPSPTALRYGAWSAGEDTQIVSHWDLNAWHHPSHLTMQIKALAYSARPACVLRREGEEQGAKFQEHSLAGEVKWMRRYWYPFLDKQIPLLQSLLEDQIVQVTVGSSKAQTQ